MRAWHGLSILGGLVGVATLAAAQTPSLTLIDPPGREVETRATGISSDGRVVAGYSSSGGSGFGFTWSASGGLDDYGHRSGVPPFTRANAISGNGLVSVGRRFLGTTQEAYRYDNGTYQTLVPSPAGYDRSEAFGTNNDGSVIVGSMGQTGGFLRPMRWTESTGMQDVGLPSNTHLGGWFTGMSRNGSTAIGISGPGDDGLFSPYTWTQAGGWRYLPRPASIPAADEARANGVNFDGSLVAGFVDAAGSEVRSAILWQNAQPMILGSFGSGWNMEAAGVSDSGRIIVGSGSIIGGVYEPVLWMNGGTPVQLQDYLDSLGVSTPAGWRMSSCLGVSSDGSTIVGLAVGEPGYRAFVATIPSPCFVFTSLVSSLVILRRRRTLA